MYKIKEKPEDFIVEELIDLETTSEGKFAYLKLQKTNLNTVAAIKQLSHALNINSKSVGFCGNKDKHAITSQFVSIPSSLKNKSQKLSINGISLSFAGYGNKRLFLGAHKGNRFLIQIKELSNSLRFHRTRFMPNYFGEQRFSKVNAQVGKLLLNKNYKAAAEIVEEEIVRRHLDIHSTEYINAFSKVPGRVLIMYMHAYQSALFNRILAQTIKPQSSEYRLVKTDFGELVFPVEKKGINYELEIPLAGFETLNDLQASPSAKVVLSEEGLNTKSFVNKQIPILSLPGSSRTAYAQICDLSFEVITNKGKTYDAVISFSLPKGSYATIALRSLLY